MDAPLSTRSFKGFDETVVCTSTNGKYVLVGFVMILYVFRTSLFVSQGLEDLAESVDDVLDCLDIVFCDIFTLFALTLGL